MAAQRSRVASSGLGLLACAWLLRCGGGPAAPVDHSWSQPEPSATAGSRAAPATIVWQERFGTMPSDWESPSGHDAGTVARIYSVRSIAGEGPVLSALHDAAPRAGYLPPPAVHFGRAFREPAVELRQACLLEWRWRVLEHPLVTDDPWLDVAASLYVMIRPPGLLTGGQGFKFGWLAKAGPAGTDQRGLLQVELRHEPAGEAWRRERVNLCGLYRQAYGDPAEERLLYVGVVTDADDTESTAHAEYADLVLRRRP